MKQSGVIWALAFLSASLIAVVAWQASLLREQKAARLQSEVLSAGTISSASDSADPRRHSTDLDRAHDDGPAAGAELQIGSAASDGVTTNWPKFDWRLVESEDYRTYVKNLRAIGCPEQTVRDIVAADVRQAFVAQRAEAMAERLRDFKYWKSDAEEADARAALETRQREVDETMRAAVRELLGADAAALPTDADWQQAAWSQQLGFLPPDKRGQTVALLLQSAELDRQIQRLAGGSRTPENPEERMRVLGSYEHKKGELQGWLTPEEYELVEMTTSWTANNLRRAMTKFQPTEEEFRAIFREWRQQDENLATIFAKGLPDPGKEHVFINISKLLTPERYTLYRETWWK